MCDILDPKAIIFFQARLISISLESFSPHSRKHESSKPKLLFSFGKTARFRMGAEYLKWQFSPTLKKKCTDKRKSPLFLFNNHLQRDGISRSLRSNLITDCTGTERRSQRKKGHCLGRDNAWVAKSEVAG